MDENVVQQLRANHETIAFEYFREKGKKAMTF
jgi:hypothetical protein